MGYKLHLVLLAVVLLDPVQSTVLQVYKNLSCPEGQETFHMEHRTENVTLSNCQLEWTEADKVIAVHWKQSNCTEPCVSISDQGMNVSVCGNYTLSAYCEIKQQGGEEIKVHYRGNSVQMPQVSVAPCESRHRWLALASVLLLCFCGIVILAWAKWTQANTVPSASDGECPSHSLSLEGRVSGCAASAPETQGVTEGSAVQPRSCEAPRCTAVLHCHNANVSF
ncbi:hypothetical protein GN956_G22226 [Arapaima gigas]